jgi:signal transduction histidine kinase
MKTGSLRFKLIAWNLIVLALAIIAVSTAQSYRIVSQLERDIDNGLQQIGREASRMGPPGRGPMGGPGMQNPRGPFNPMPGQNPGHPGEMPHMSPFGPPPGELGRGGPPPEMLSDVRRPRFFDMDGLGVGPSRAQTSLDPDALQRGLQGWQGFTERDGIRIYTIPWREGGPIRGAIQVAHELRDVHLLKAGQLHNVLLLLPAALLLAGVGAFFLAERALKPIAALTKTAQKIGASDLSQRIEISGDDEFAELGHTFNQMIARLETSFQELRQAYADLEVAFDKQRQFTADASHELRTPLTRIKLATSSALSGSEDVRRAVEVADHAAAVMAKLIDQLLMLAQADAGSLASRNAVVDLRLVASDAISSIPGDPPVEVHFPEDPIEVVGDAELLGRVVTNLVENALRYSEGKVTVSVAEAAGHAELWVQDQGPGIAAEHLPRIFDRFYRVDVARTRSAGGSGLGLAICKSIVEAHHGQISVSSQDGKGTDFKVTLPLAKTT